MYGSEKWGVESSEVQCSEVVWNDVNCREVKWLSWVKCVHYPWCIIMQLCVGSVQRVISLLIASLCYFLITWLIFFNIVYICFLFYIFVVYFVYSVFLYICVLFLLLCYLIPIFVQDYRPLPPGGNQIAVNNYRHRHHHHHHHHQLQQCLGEGSSALRFAYIAPLVSVLLSSAQRFEAFWSSLPNPPFKPICTKVALVKKIESSVHMSPRHRSMLLGVRSGSTRRHVTFCICVMALNFILTSACLVAMQCLHCVYSWYLPLVLLSLSSSSLWERPNIQQLQFDVKLPISTRLTSRAAACVW